MGPHGPRERFKQRRRPKRTPARQEAPHRCDRIGQRPRRDRQRGRRSGRGRDRALCPWRVRAATDDHVHARHVSAALPSAPAAARCQARPVRLCVARGRPVDRAVRVGRLQGARRHRMPLAPVHAPLRKVCARRRRAPYSLPKSLSPQRHPRRADRSRPVIFLFSPCFFLLLRSVFFFRLDRWRRRPVCTFSKGKIERRQKKGATAILFFRSCQKGGANREKGAPAGRTGAVADGKKKTERVSRQANRPGRQKKRPRRRGHGRSGLG